MLRREQCNIILWPFGAALFHFLYIIISGRGCRFILVHSWCRGKWVSSILPLGRVAEFVERGPRIWEIGSSVSGRVNL